MNKTTLEDRNTVSLDYTNGEVIPYKDYNLPESLSIPLRSNINGKINALESGMRSVLLMTEGNWFKYKGMRPKPIPFPFWNGVEPYGSMIPESSKKELEANEFLNRKFQEYGFGNGPLIPAARVEYDVPFEDKKCNAAVLECFGDSRLMSVFEAIENSNKKYKINTIEKLYSDISSWLGFSQKMLQENNLLFPRGNNDCQNYVFFEVNHNYGVSLVDHDATRKCNEKNELKESIERTKKQSIYSLLEMTDMVGLNLDLEKYNSLLNTLEKTFYDSYDGKIIPEPIHKNFLLQFFS